MSPDPKIFPASAPVSAPFAQEKRLPIFEVGAYCLESALAAEAGGADRVELCANRPEGGVTPSAGMVEVVRASISIGLWVMIRPRPHDFLYSEGEMEVMLADIAQARRLGADGVVFGLLTPDGRIDRERTAMLLKAARPMQVTFHRAFDVCRDLSEGLEDLIDLGVPCVLSSGGAPNALAGVENLANLTTQAAGRIEVMAARLEPGTVGRVAQRSGVQAFHFGARGVRESEMVFRNPQVRMGAEIVPEYAWPVACSKEVVAMKEAVLAAPLILACESGAGWSSGASEERRFR